MNKDKRQQIYAIWRKNNPNPKTELVYASHFELLISVMLSAQATDISVNKATKALYKKHKTPESFITLGVDGLKGYIKSIGLYNTKAVNVIKTCHQLVALHNSIVPNDRASLEALPGVGRKTANVILNSAFGEPTMAVDTHIFRISNRIGLAPGKTPLEVEKKLLKCTPKEFLVDAHHWLILHGRYICVARKPKCDACPIYDLCEYKGKIQK